MIRSGRSSPAVFALPVAGEPLVAASAEIMSHSLHRNWIIFILGALGTITPFAVDMYLPAFPEMATALHTTTARISLSLASYRGQSPAIPRHASCLLTATAACFWGSSHLY